MHDIRAIRADPAAFDAAMARRGLPPAAEAVLAEDARRRAAQTALEARQARRNALAREIGQAKRGGADTAALEARGRVAPRRDGGVGGRGRRGGARRRRRCSRRLPNLLDADVPDGADETANLVLHQHGEPPASTSPRSQHFEIGEALGLMDFAAAAKLAGSRFTVLRGALARLERALGQWMLDLHTGGARLHRNRRAAAGQRRRHVRHRPAPEIRRGLCSAPPTAAG